MAGFLSTAYALRFVQGRSAKSLLLHLALAWLFALSLTAALWLPALEIMARSERRNLHEWVRGYYSLHPYAVLQAVLPLRWDELPIRASLAAAINESRAPLLASVYLGAPALGLALSSFARPRRGQLILVLVALLSIGVALGKFGILYPLATTLFPPFRILRYPIKVTVVTAFVTAILAGLGFDAASDSALTRRARLLGLVLPLGLLLLVAAVSRALLLRPERWAHALLEWDSSREALLKVLALSISRVEVALALASAAFVLAALSLFWPKASRLLLVGVAAGAVLDLVLADGDLNHTAPTAFFRYRPPLLDLMPRHDYHRVYLRPYLLIAQGKRYYRADLQLALYPEAGADRETLRLAESLALLDVLYAPAGGRFHVETSYDPDQLGFYSQGLSRMVETVWLMDGRPEQLRLFQVASVSRVVSPQSLGFENLPALSLGKTPYPDPVHVFEVPDPLPRCYAVSGAVVEKSDEQALSRLMDPGFDPRTEVVLSSGTPSSPIPGFRASCAIKELVPDRVELEASLSKAGTLVLVDAYDAGWRVSVDGKPAPLLRANVAFRAIPVSEGPHRVQLLYRPASVSLGVCLSLGTLALGIVGVFKKP
jgi:hypothetical protein